MEFIWDERKNRANQKKHRISFETAIHVFDDPFTSQRKIARLKVERDGRLSGWSMEFISCWLLIP